MLKLGIFGVHPKSTAVPELAKFTQMYCQSRTWQNLATEHESGGLSTKKKLSSTLQVINKEGNMLGLC